MNICKDVDGKTSLYCIIGNPIEHTMSPYLHNTISRNYNENSIYVPIKIAEADFFDTVKNLPKIGIKGFNVTIPYKNKIIETLDEITVEAKLMGAVNTVHVKNGKMYGYNTDADGFLESIKKTFNYDFNNKTATIIGAGGTSRSISVKIAFAGAKKIYIINRTIDKAREIASIVNDNINNIVETIELSENNIQEVINFSDIIINTTSLGMFPNINKSPIDEQIVLKGQKIFYDVIYTPYETKFLSIARKNNCKTLNGIGMLFYQGIIANEIWNNRKIDKSFKTKIFYEFSKILSLAIEKK